MRRQGVVGRCGADQLRIHAHLNREQLAAGHAGARFGIAHGVALYEDPVRQRQRRAAHQQGSQRAAPPRDHCAQPATGARMVAREQTIAERHRKRHPIRQRMRTAPAGQQKDRCGEDGQIARDDKVVTPALAPGDGAAMRGKAQQFECARRRCPRDEQTRACRADFLRACAARWWCDEIGRDAVRAQAFVEQHAHIGAGGRRRVAHEHQDLHARTRIAATRFDQNNT